MESGLRLMVYLTYRDLKYKGLSNLLATGNMEGEGHQQRLLVLLVEDNPGMPGSSGRCSSHLKGDR